MEAALGACVPWFSCPEALNLKKELAGGEGEMSLGGGTPEILNSQCSVHSLQEVENYPLHYSQFRQ